MTKAGDLLPRQPFPLHAEMAEELAQLGLSLESLSVPLIVWRSQGSQTWGGSGGPKGE